MNHRMLELQAEYCAQGNHVLGPVLGPNLQRAQCARWCAVCHTEVVYRPQNTPESVLGLLRFPPHHFGSMTSRQIIRLLAIPRNSEICYNRRTHAVVIVLPMFENSLEQDTYDHAEEEGEES